LINNELDVIAEFQLSCLSKKPLYNTGNL